MTIELLLKDKTKKAKEKTEIISQWLSDGSMPIDELMAYAEKAKAPEKATCIEAIEYASKQNPKIADENVLRFVIQMLSFDAPRVKWESAKVIGNIAHLFPNQLDLAIKSLLVNTKFDGTVVRWATAFALGEILKLKTEYNETLLPIIEALSEAETENGVRKKYLDALKKVKK